MFHGLDSVKQGPSSGLLGERSDQAVTVAGWVMGLTALPPCRNYKLIIIIIIIIIIIK